METVRLLRNAFIRSFLVGAALAFVSAAVTMAGWNAWMPIAARFFHTDSVILTW